ncbi:hypothetical protein QJS10_CPA03g00951 [Acorus calamus]|uniref:Non-specific lipid-transfer protein n=1 Tax=Acorus calamus TaxID=4465 RepID=A0AAV9F7L7_ACOCL|nr:hypothetical protein QJS10_CPA03g00951 [Acorus calamus]
MARTIATLAILAVAAALLLVEGPREVEAAISCGQVVKYISPCIAYAQKGGAISPDAAAGSGGSTPLRGQLQTANRHARASRAKHVGPTRATLEASLPSAASTSLIASALTLTAPRSGEQYF